MLEEELFRTLLKFCSGTMLPLNCRACQGSRALDLEISAM